MKTNLKTQHSTTQPVGRISKCLQQMINVSSNVKAPKRQQQIFTKTFINKSKNLKTLPELDDNEKPREFVPFPENNINKQRLSLNEKKPLLKKFDNIDEDFNQLVEKVKEVRMEEMNFKKIGLKKKKDWEYSLILEDFKFRLLEKVFFSFLQKKIRLKKNTKSLIENSLETRKTEKNFFIFSSLKDIAMQRKKKREFFESMKACMDFNILRTYYKKWLIWFFLKRNLIKKREKIFETSLFYSLKSCFRKMSDYHLYAKKYRLFKKSRSNQLKYKCFTAMKPEKINMSNIKEKFKSLKIDESQLKPIEFNFFRSKIYFTKKISKELRSVKLSEIMLYKSIFENNKFMITKGKFNLEEIKKMFFKKALDLLKRKAFYSIKLIHLDSQKEHLAFKYHELKLKTKLIEALKLNKKVNFFNISQKARLAQLFHAITIKKQFIKKLKSKTIIKKTRIKAYLLAKALNLMKKYTTYKKNKKECLGSISKAYIQKFKSKILHNWSHRVKKLQPINDLYKTNLKKRYLLKLLNIFKKKQLLKKYLKLISLEEENSLLENSPFRLLKEIMKQWKEQVIESENTKKQKIHNFMAINHRRNTMKYRVFLVWSQRKFKRKAMNTIVSHMSRCLNEKIIQKWRNYVYYKSFKIEEVKNYLITFHKNLTFQKLKGYYLQEKIIKSFQKKKIFSKWKEGFVFRRIYWPSKLKDFNLKKKVFKAFIENKIMKINKSKIQQYLKIFHKRKMFKIFLKECVKMMALKKKTEYLIMTREIRIKKKLLKILSTNRLKKKLREKQMKIAIKFHARKKFNIYERSEENIFRNENLFFKVFSFLKTNLYRKKVNDTIFERFILLRERKMKKQLFNVWYEKHIKLFEKNRKIPNLYEIDLGKYQTPKFQIPHITFLKESVSSNLNKSSNSFWLKQYEENEKYMNELLMDKK